MLVHILLGPNYTTDGGEKEKLNSILMMILILQLLTMVQKIISVELGISVDMVLFQAAMKLYSTHLT